MLRKNFLKRIFLFIGLTKLVEMQEIVYKISKNQIFEFKFYILIFLNRSKKGVFYDETYDNVEDIVSHSVKLVNMNLKNITFSFEYSIVKVENYNSYKLTKMRKFAEISRKSHLLKIKTEFLIFL